MGEKEFQSSTSTCIIIDCVGNLPTKIVLGTHLVLFILRRYGQWHNNNWEIFLDYEQERMKTLDLWTTSRLWVVMTDYWLCCVLGCSVVLWITQATCYLVTQVTACYFVTQVTACYLVTQVTTTTTTTTTQVTGESCAWSTIDYHQHVEKAIKQV